MNTYSRLPMPLSPPVIGGGEQCFSRCKAGRGGPLSLASTAPPGLPRPIRISASTSSSRLEDIRAGCAPSAAAEGFVALPGWRGPATKHLSQRSKRPIDGKRRPGVGDLESKEAAARPAPPIPKKKGLVRDPAIGREKADGHPRHQPTLRTTWAIDLRRRVTRVSVHRPAWA